MLIQARTLDSAIINGKKANTYSISFANILTQPSAWLSSTNGSFAVKAKRILKSYVFTGRI
jgi:hypothetical protein